MTSHLSVTEGVKGELAEKLKYAYEKFRSDEQLVLSGTFTFAHVQKYLVNELNDPRLARLSRKNIKLLEDNYTRDHDLSHLEESTLGDESETDSQQLQESEETLSVDLIDHSHSITTSHPPMSDDSFDLAENPPMSDDEEHIKKKHYPPNARFIALWAEHNCKTGERGDNYSWVKAVRHFRKDFDAVERDKPLVKGNTENCYIKMVEKLWQNIGKRLDHRCADARKVKKEGGNTYDRKLVNDDKRIAKAKSDEKHRVQIDLTSEVVEGTLPVISSSSSSKKGSKRVVEVEDSDDNDSGDSSSDDDEVVVPPVGSDMKSSSSKMNYIAKTLKLDG